ncbi:hypothetical protein M513_07666 [Trichuris suis]|uniref:EGF-like domain protein n=1 Tax=Trichuris suis TaxID=68888 RepID=A0A085M2K7_9BILA|nr:hypothetical protein M513_07666 [Trichuris suis]
MPTIAEEWPWAYAVHNSCRKDYCHYCLRRCGYALECSSCEFAVYCNDHCQAKAWETHRPECIFITRCPDSVPCGMVRLFSRIVVKLNNGGENEGSWFKTDYSSYERRLFKNLMSHQTRLFLESKRIREFAECCYALRSFMHSENIPFSSGLMEIFGKIVVNAFSILNDDLNPIGIGVYLNLSQLDHACDAENVVMFDGARALLNCLNPDHVDTNSDLRTHTISYDSVICETESRRRTLQSRYYFTCRCRRCLDLDLDAIATSSKCTDPDCNGHVLLDVETGGGKCDGCSKTVDDLWPSVNLMLRVEKQNDALEERVPEEMNILSWRFIRSYFLLTLLLFSSAALFALNISLTALFSRNEKYYSTAAELLRQEANLLHPYNVHLIRTKFFLAHAAMELSRYDEALDLYQQLLPCLKFYVHANHPTIAVNKIGVGNLLKRKKKWIEAKQNFTEVMKLTDLLLISICSALTFHYGRPAECEERWEPYGWITISYLTSCVTFVPNDQIDHCAQEASKQQLIYGQKYTVECIDKYCDDNFPAGYFWSWIPDEPQEKFLLDTFVHEWSETMHGAAFICTTSADNNTHADPCVTIRSNRSVTIQGNDPTTYDSCNATREVPDASDYKRRSCAMLSSHFFQKDVDKHYVCLTLDAQRSLLQFTTTHYCNKAPYRYFTCGHEGEFPCERIRTLACNFNKDLKHCVSYYYTKAPPDREKYQRCQFDYGSRCNCSCSNNYSQWTSWSGTCKPSSRMRIAPFLQPNGQLEPVNCSFENMGECCVQTEINPSSELEDCTNYIYGTNISLVKYNCSEPFGTRIVDEKGHFKCQCTGGYEGMFCENPPSICLSKPCKNGGACSSDGDRYLCNCMPGFKGFQCEETYETCDKGQKCENGGKCTKSQETYACNCTSNYTGVHCEYEVQYCENDTCLPNGKCQNVTTLRTYRCHCGKSHTGRRCEYAVEYCKPESCSGHGICYNLSPGNIKCLCYIGYGGPFCGLNLYVLGAPFCLCAVFLIALLLLRRCRKKHAMMTKTTKATRSRRLSADGPRRKSSGKPLQEVAKKPPSHDYVLPTFTEDSNAGKTPGKAAAALILKTWASHWNAHCRTMGSASILTFQWPHAREAEIEGDSSVLLNIYVSAPSICLSKPCKNGGACSSDGDRYLCNCMPGFKGFECEERMYRISNYHFIGNYVPFYNAVSFYDRSILGNFFFKLVQVPLTFVPTGPQRHTKRATKGTAAKTKEYAGDHGEDTFATVCPATQESTANMCITEKYKPFILYLRVKSSLEAFGATSCSVFNDYNNRALCAKLGIVEVILAYRTVNVRTSLPSARLDVIAKLPTRVVVASMVSVLGLFLKLVKFCHMVYTAVEYCKADSCSGHGYCRNLTSGKTKCVCYTGYVGEFCDFNLYVVVLPVCICGAVLGGLPMLQKRHRKKSMPRRKSLRSPHSPRSSDGQSKSATRSKPAEEERKKAAKHDYVLPVFSVESVAHTYSGKATGALILSAYAPHWNCELEKRTFYFQWPHVREAEVKAIRMSSELGSIWMDDIQIFDKLCHLSPTVVEHCSHDNPKEKFRMGQKYWTECIDKYCDDNFPFGYYWTWMPDQAEEKRVIHSIRHGWGEILHGASLICTTSGDDTNRHPCVTERSNRSLSIQGNKPEVYDGCYGIPRTDDSYDFHIRSCRGCRSFFLRDDVDKHYVCLILSRSPDRLHFTFAHHCTAMTHTFASCGHEGVFPCDRNRTLGCNFNKDLKHCVSYYYTKAPPDRENTCKPSSRMRIAPFLQANDQLEPVNCSFENMGECCVQTEVNPSAELEDCTDYVYGTNISLVKYNCSEPFGTRIVDEKGHFKCQCTGGYEGIFCENPPPICLSKPCKNGGTCSSDGRYHLCDCLPGFKRFECHQSFQTCDKGQKCENGGECMKSQESYTFANVSRPTQESTANMNLSIVKAIIARRMVNVRTSLPSARLGATATRPTQVVVASMLRHIPVTAVAYCKPNSCGGHVICQNLTSGKTKCVCYTGYAGEFCHFSLYATVLPGCIGAAVLGALLILRKRRRKDGAATKSAMTRRRSTLLSLSFNVPAKLTAASKTPQERKKKPTGADYVLPVFNASSSTRTSSGKAKVTLIIRISTRLLICCECCRIERSYGDLSSWDKQEIKTSNDTMLAFLRLSFYESAPTVCSSCIAMGALILTASAPRCSQHWRNIGCLTMCTSEIRHPREAETKVMKATELLFLSICNALMLRYARPLDCLEKWVPLRAIEHCAQHTQQFLVGQKYWIECIDKYCHDEFPAGYFWTWMPDYAEERAEIPFIPRSNPYTYASCYGVRRFDNLNHRYLYYRRSCSGFRSSFFRSDVGKHYVCLVLRKKFRYLYFAEANYCDALSHKFLTCGHEGRIPCARNRTFGCNFNKELKHCVSYYYPDVSRHRKQYEWCQLDYGPRCNCSCSNSYSQWTSWSGTCKPLTRMRIAPFLQPNDQLPPVSCSFDNMGECCVETEVDSSSELEDCTNYIYGTNISLLKYNCSQPGGTRGVDEKGHFKCQCAEGYEGMFCQNTPLNCLNKPCMNGGSCSSDGYYYFCDCPPGFKGFQCEQPYRTCDKGQKCENSGVCTKSRDSYVCQCMSGYTGVHCEYSEQVVSLLV